MNRLQMYHVQIRDKDMPLRQIVTIPDPVLYQRSKEVEIFDRNLRSLVSDMFDVMYDEDGVGLAAVQVGVLKRVFIVDLREPKTRGVFVNPELLEFSDETKREEEGCLSVPGIVAFLKRPRWVKISYKNLLGEGQIMEAENLMARALLHEMDHLDGKIYTNLLEPHIKEEIQTDLKRIEMGKRVDNSRIPAYRRKISVQR